MALPIKAVTPTYENSANAVESNQTYLDILITFSWGFSQNSDVRGTCRGLTSKVLITSLLSPHQKVKSNGLVSPP